MEFNKNNLILCNMNDYKIILLVSIAGLATILGNVVVLFKFKNKDKKAKVHSFDTNILSSFENAGVKGVKK